MGHYVTPGPSGNISVSNRPFNTVTGTFGGGNVAFITATQTFTFPATAFRVRLWGGGANGQATGVNGGIAGGGGGFAMKTFTGQTAGSTVTATIGAASGTTSFGSLFSASGGHPTNGGAGIGISGDINKTGSSGGGGGATGVGGGAAGNILLPLGIGGVLNSSGMNGPFGKGGNFITNGSSNGDHGIDFSLDGYGCGGGGSGGSATIYGGNGNNGGGGGTGIVCGNGGFPGGAGGGPGTIVGGVGGAGAPGLIIVEW